MEHWLKPNSNSNSKRNRKFTFDSFHICFICYICVLFTLSCTKNNAIKTKEDNSRNSLVFIIDANSSIKIDVAAKISNIIEAKISIFKFNTDTFIPDYGGFRISNYCGISIFDFINCSDEDILKYYKELSWGNMIYSK